VDTLREEVLTSQGVRSDLLKYKLVAVGGIGAVGLGLAGAEVRGNADLVLAAVPLACLYIDLLCRHLSLRILVIGTFIRRQGEGSVAAYETFADNARELPDGHRTKSAFALEDWAVSWSTLVLSAAVLAYGIAAIIGDRPPWFWATLIGSGGVGIAVTWAARLIYRDRSELVRSMHTG
jgi:hypothetical protein